MCCAAYPAEFNNTKIAMHQPDPARVGRDIPVLLYQNAVDNRFGGPNAMLLGIDTSSPMGPENFIPTTEFRHVLDDMVDALVPKSRGPTFSLGAGGLTESIQVFDVGAFTAVLAQGSASGFEQALQLVHPRKRPRVNRDQFQLFAEQYPATALCCFNDSFEEAEPLMLWWEPREPEIFRMPALDEHAGRVPRVESAVRVDHWLIASSYRLPGDGGNPVSYREGGAIPPDVRELLPDRVIGTRVDGFRPNGDFGVSLSDVVAGSFPRDPLRLPPPGVNL
jgi:hypothetical protein